MSISSIAGSRAKWPLKIMILKEERIYWAISSLFMVYSSIASPGSKITGGRWMQMAKDMDNRDNLAAIPIEPKPFHLVVIEFIIVTPIFRIMNNEIKFVETASLRIGYAEDGPADG